MAALHLFRVHPAQTLAQPLRIGHAGDGGTVGYRLSCAALIASLLGRLNPVALHQCAHSLTQHRKQPVDLSEVETKLCEYVRGLAHITV